MKRITKPQSDMPEVYKEMSTVHLEDIEQAKPQMLAEFLNAQKTENVPVAKYGGVNLKKYKSFKVSRQKTKLSNQEAIARIELTPWLQSIDIELNMYNLELISDIASWCHKFFIYGSKEQREASVDKVVMECILPYCRGDKEVAKALLLSVDDKVMKPGKFARRWQKTVNFFFTMTNIVLSSSRAV